MIWYEEIEKNLEYGKIYSHNDLFKELQKIKHDVTDSTYNWAIRTLTSNGNINRLGYDAYTISNNLLKKEYYPSYSNVAKELIDKIDKAYPYVRFTVFETIIMNDFLNHLIAQNTIFIQVEKQSSIYIFRYLQEQGFQNVLYRPNKNDFDLYWSKNVIVVTNLITEAPLRLDNSHIITIEKMLVDMISDKLIFQTYSINEYASVIQQAENQYYVDKARLLRYARRRNKEKEIRKYLNME